MAASLLLSGCVNLRLGESAAKSSSARASAMYRVRSGDTMGSIAKQYAVPEASLAKANGLAPGAALKSGQTLRIPASQVNLASKSRWPSWLRGSNQSGDTGYADAAAVIGKACPRPTNEALPKMLRNGESILPENTRGSETGRVGTAFVQYDVVSNPGQCGSRGMCWPVIGCVTRPFDLQLNHKGLDICAEEGTPIMAARDGRVIYSDSELAGFGNLVIIDHGSGLATVYAHNRRNIAKRGDKVKRGDIIAEVGMTGRATAPHCHFEVRKDGKPVDPRPYLP